MEYIFVALSDKTNWPWCASIAVFLASNIFPNSSWNIVTFATKFSIWTTWWLFKNLGGIQLSFGYECVTWRDKNRASRETNCHQIWCLRKSLNTSLRNIWTILMEYLNVAVADPVNKPNYVFLDLPLSSRLTINFSGSISLPNHIRLKWYFNISLQLQYPSYHISLKGDYTLLLSNFVLDTTFKLIH